MESPERNALATDTGTSQQPDVDFEEIFNPETSNGRLDPVATGLRQAPVLSTAIRTLAVSVDSNLIAMGTGGGEIAIWNENEQKIVNRWNAHEHWVFDLMFDPNSERLISAGGDQMTKIWSTSDWKLLQEFADHDDDVHGAVLTADGKHLVTCGDDMLVIVRNLESGAVTKLEGHEAQVTSIVLSKDERFAFTSSRDQTIRIWDLQELTPSGVLTGHQEDVLHLAIDPNGENLASASYDGTVRVWSIADHKLLQEFRVPDKWMLAVAFSEDGSQVFTGSTDSLVRSFDRESGKETWKSFVEADVSDLAILSKENQLLASTTTVGVKRFNLSTDKDRLAKSIHLDWPEQPEIIPLSHKEYLLMHEALLFELDQPDWGRKVGLLSLYGDHFTLKLLDGIKIEELPAPKRELVHRLKDKLRFLDHALPHHSIDLIKKYWGRQAVADFYDLQVAGGYQLWLNTQTKAFLESHADYTSQLNTFEDSVALALVELTTESEKSKNKASEVQKNIMNRIRVLFEKSGRLPPNRSPP